MAVPAWFNSGTGSNTAFSVSPTPSYPASISAGYLAILHNYVRGDSAGTLTPPGDWTFLITRTHTTTTTISDVYYKVLSGSESGTITVTSGGTAGRRASWIHVFSGDAGTWNFEDVDSEIAATSTTINDNNVTTSGADRLAINLIGYSGQQTGNQEDFVGETGGTWVARAWFEGGNNPTLSLQTAGMASSGTVGGGSDVTITSSITIIFGLAIYVTAATGQPTIKRRGGVPFTGPMRGIW